MKQYFNYLIFVALLLASCSGKKSGNLPEFPVDFGQNIESQLPLSEITESIEAIELEMTDESVIDPRPGLMQRIIISDNLLIIAQSKKIFVFDRNGKFIRSIGSKGQGPGEYISINSIAYDESNKLLFVGEYTKIIIYDLEGHFLKEVSLIRHGNPEIGVKDMNFINNELLILVYSIGSEDENGLYNQTELYRLNDDLQVMDSCLIRKIYERPGFSFSPLEDYILLLNSDVYLYYPYVFDPRFARTGRGQSQITLRDTLFRFENNRPVPELKLKFKNDGIDGGGNSYISLLNIFRSDRYIFATYYSFFGGLEGPGYPFYFCHDTKTGKSYNVPDGYTDDIHNIEHVQIRPFQTNPDMFYYWHTNMKPEDTEEPNPTIYIGKLKK